MAPPDLDPAKVVRSKAYLSALIFAGILGIPISAVAYGFLSLVVQDPEVSSSPICPANVIGGTAAGLVAGALAGALRPAHRR